MLATNQRPRKKADSLSMRLQRFRKLTSIATTTNTSHGRTSTRATAALVARFECLAVRPIQSPTQQSANTSATNTEIPASQTHKFWLDVLDPRIPAIMNAKSTRATKTTGHRNWRCRESNWPRRISRTVKGVESSNSRAPLR